MLYALLYYGSEDVLAELGLQTSSATDSDENNRDVPRLEVQLLPTTTAVTVRWGTKPIVVDGPLALARHELLKLEIIDVANLDKALALVEDSLRNTIATVACEIRPLVSLETP